MGYMVASKEIFMNAKEAREIVKHGGSLNPPSIYRAEGFLEADAQWKDSVRPLVKALVNIKSVADSFAKNPMPQSTYLMACEAVEALSQFRTTQENDMQTCNLCSEGNHRYCPQRHANGCPCLAQGGE